MMAHDAISVLSNIINDESLIDHAQIIHNSFTRKRKISLDNLLNYLIFRNHDVLSQDLVSYFGAMCDFDIPTRQAMIKRMSILNYDVWDFIMYRFRNEIYNELPLINFKDYIPLLKYLDRFTPPSAFRKETTTSSSSILIPKSIGKDSCNAL